MLDQTTQFLLQAVEACAWLALLALVPVKGAVYGSVLLVAYSIGHCGLILAGGTSMGLVQKMVDSKGWTKGVGVIRKLAGVLIFSVGILLLKQ